jgi:putative serine protease PepD
MDRPGKRGFASLAAALALGAAVGAGGYAIANNGSGGDGGSASAASRQNAAATTTTSTGQTAAVSTKTLTVGQVYAKDSPGVVKITVTTSSGGGTNGFPFGGGSTSTAQGSGFVYDSAGHVITNEHVIAGATSAKVQFADGKTYSATVVGSDTSSDLAVLKVEAPASELHPLALANSSSVHVGDGVVAIGSPFGLSETMTAGIVSALNRQIQATNGVEIGGAIQTDAAINHGNSGGALIDMSGNVIGVTAQIESDSGDNAGVGFAIPSSTVKNIASQIIAGQKVQPAYLGVSISSTASSAVVGSVQSGTAAAQAGLQAGDVITAVNGQSVSDYAALGAAIAAHKPGDKVTLTYTRNGTSKTVTVTLGARPASS